MKEKYTLTVANSQINIITEASKEEIDAIVGIVDRRIREIHLHSKSCSRTDAAVLLCLDYCAEKIELQKTIKASNAQIERLTVMNEVAEREIASLEREIETLRASLNMTSTRQSAKKAPDTQIGFDDISDDAHLEIPADKTAEETAIEKILAPDTDVAEESLTPPEDAHAAEDIAAEAPAEEHEKPHAKARKKKVRAMFDMISFDDI